MLLNGPFIASARPYRRTGPTALERKLTRRLLLGGGEASLFSKAALAVASGGIVEKPAGDRFWSALEQLPYAPEGAGIPLFILGYSSCPYCLAFHREWKGKLPGIQFRWVMYGVNVDPRSGDQAADVAVTRDPGVVQAYFDRTRVAPPKTSSQERIEAFNRVVKGTDIVTSELSKRNIRALMSPTFLFKESRGVVAFTGYSKESFDWLISQSRRFTA